ncbi:MAG: UvrD-helicase domain-containing protein, partial [Nitriliruptorales bacterium]|nr:UvrD-helicase domain-containing protein [Nitriliruptorales bacterium]
MTDTTPGASFPGPAALGRGAVVAAGAPTPPDLEAARRIRVDDEVLAAPREIADRLHRSWVRREPVVVELAVDNDTLREPEVCSEPPHDLAGGFGFDRERLYFLTWANNYDCRTGTPVWHLATHHAASLGATPDDHRDVRLPDGTAAWVDGGPRGPVPAIDAPLVHRESVRLLQRLRTTENAPPHDDLAPDQLAAVTHRSGPARILAPAGSGKTRVLTARLRHLLRDR